MSATDDDLLIVGAGHLGSRIARHWRRLHPSANIIGETKTETSHEALRDIGVTPVLAGSSSASFPNVVFCVPPRGDPAYSDVVGRAASRATRRFVFTSSTSVHGGVQFVTEDTPTSDKGRASFLHHAENVALQRHVAVVVRLAGLYLIDRGPHTFWLSKQLVSGSEKALINLVHYDDAAAAMVCALRLSELPDKRTFLIAAPEAVTRRQIVECALKHPRFKGVAVPEFLNDQPFVEKRIDGSWSNRVLDWRPTYSSFAEFMELDGQRAAASSSVNA
ncbi:rossmann-fold nad -binding domain containing protein [Gracilaria domingensis]|nr:rossmann-fold nad -binding domain containing protein [Gracilaria domingensis]